LELLADINMQGIHSCKLLGHTNTTQHINSTLFQTATNFNKSLQSDTKQIKDITARNLKERREAKRPRGEFPRSLDEELTDKEQSYRWLKFGNIKGKQKTL
jgi:hypothetical protein